MAELSLYDVPHRNSTMRVKLSAEDAELIYGDQAKKIGEVDPAQAQPVSRPPYEQRVPAAGESDPSTGDEVKKAPVRRNKARSAESDKA